MSGGTQPGEDDGSHKDWIESVGDLAETTSPVDSREIQLDLSNLSQQEIKFLDDQTRRTLDRHSEIEQNQRQRAANILRMNLIILGAIGAAIPLVTSFMSSLQFPSNISIYQGVVAYLLFVITLGILDAIATDIIAIIDSTFDILSPEKTERGAWGSLLSYVGFFPSRTYDKESGGGIRSVSILSELAPIVDKPTQGVQKEVLINRLNRIRRNERALNQNDEHLHDTFQRAKLGLERLVAAFFFVIVTLLILGASLQP